MLIHDVKTVFQHLYGRGLAVVVDQEHSVCLIGHVEAVNVKLLARGESCNLGLDGFLITHNNILHDSVLILILMVCWCLRDGFVAGDMLWSDDKKLNIFFWRQIRLWHRDKVTSPRPIGWPEVRRWMLVEELFLLNFFLRILQELNSDVTVTENLIVLPPVFLFLRYRHPNLFVTSKSKRGFWLLDFYDMRRSYY